MSVIYLSQDGLSVHKSGGKILIKQNDKELFSLPRCNVENIVVMSNVQISHAVIMDILDRGGTIVYLDKAGSIKGYLGQPLFRGETIIKQAMSYNDPVKRIQIAKVISKNKLLTQKSMLLSYNKRIKSENIKKAVVKIMHFVKLLDNQTDIDKLLGIEGITAKTYYDCFPQIMSNSCFVWQGRNRRPPKDPINSMLSFAYYLLEKDVKMCLMEMGLVSSIGFLHSVDNYRESLVYDIIETFRTSIAEKFVFKAINLKMFTLDDFCYDADKCIFTEEARKKFICAYDEFSKQEDSSGSNSCEKIKKFITEIKKMILC